MGNSTTRKLKNGAVTLDKLSKDIIDKINSASSIESVTASVDSSIGTPSVSVKDNVVDGKHSISLDFSNLKGERGMKGDKGDKGDKGEKGEPFIFSDLTQEQAESLKGPKGERGEKGLDIETIDQPIISDEDGGDNIIRITRSDGKVWNFVVKNGHKGSQGIGISNIEQTESSTADGGKNVITVTNNNGDKYELHTYNGTGRNKGYYYNSLDELRAAVPSPSLTDWAIVDGDIYVCESSGTWSNTGYSWKPSGMNSLLISLNRLNTPSYAAYLHWNGSSFDWRNPTVSSGGSSEGTNLNSLLNAINNVNPLPTSKGQVLSYNGTTYQWADAATDLTQYTWWGRTFGDGDTATSKRIVGAMNDVTSITFTDTKLSKQKMLYLDSNGDLCFDGNFYATGGITALGSGGSSSGGSSSGGSGISGITIKRNGTTVINSSDQTLVCKSINFVYPTDWSSSPILRSDDNEIKVDLSVIAANASGGTSANKNPFTIYNGDSGSITYDGSSPSYIKFKDGFTLSKVGLGYEISCTGSSSGGSTTGNLYFTKGSSQESFNGSSNFNVVFGDGINVSWDSHSKITLSAGTVDLSSYVTTSALNTKLSDYLKKTETAASATKLATTRTIWGQNFNGEQDISGNMNNVGAINFTSKDSSTGNPTVMIQASGKSLLGLNANKDIYIGYSWYQDTDAHITLYGSKTLINTYDGTTSRNWWFQGKFLVSPSDGEIVIGNGKLTWDETNRAIRVTSYDGKSANFYADGGITALGVQATSTSSSDFTFKSVTSSNYNFSNGSYLTETYSNSDKKLTLYHAGSAERIIMDSGYDDVNSPWVGNIIDSTCMSFKGADWYYFDNTIVANQVETNSVTFVDNQGNMGLTLNNIEVQHTSGQTKLIFTIDNEQYSVNVN